MPIGENSKNLGKNIFYQKRVSSNNATFFDADFSNVENRRIMTIYDVCRKPAADTAASVAVTFCEYLTDLLQTQVVGFKYYGVDPEYGSIVLIAYVNSCSYNYVGSAAQLQTIDGKTFTVSAVQTRTLVDDPSLYDENSYSIVCEEVV